MLEAASKTAGVMKTMGFKRVEVSPLNIVKTRQIYLGRDAATGDAPKNPTGNHRLTCRICETGAPMLALFPRALISTIKKEVKGAPRFLCRFNIAFIFFSFGEGRNF